MRVELAYGRGILPVELPDDTRVIRPRHHAALPDEKRAFLDSLKSPLASPPLLGRIKPTDRLCILFTDNTRATPNHRIIPWLLEHLADHPRENILLLNQLGTHRPNTRDELAEMLTPEILDRYQVLNHDCEADDLVQIGETRDGTPALLNRRAHEADLRIVTGFIEPHFFAGFSGGPKGLVPGVAGLRTVMSNHGSAHISDPNATFGVTHGNPLWEELLRLAQLAGPSFLINVTLNENRELTRVFSGDLEEAHRQGCQHVKASAMQAVDEPFDIVLTTNSGHPLDCNLYQGVKGMSAAARIVKPGGLIILACECHDGVPADSPFDRLLREAASPEEILTLLAHANEPRPEQWQAQIQALIQRQARVLVHSNLPDETLTACHLHPCHDIAQAVSDEITQLPHPARVAVLPQGPLTIPESTGLDPQCGLLHRDRPGRPSLALDLMEEMRPVLADRTALTLLNRQQLREEDFDFRENGAVSLKEDSRKTVLQHWQERKQAEIMHPFPQEKISLGLLPHIQARLLARHLRGDLDAYPAYLVK